MTTITDETSINSSKVTIRAFENSDPAGIRNPLGVGGEGRLPTRSKVHII